MEETQRIQQRIGEYLKAKFPEREELSVGEIRGERGGESHSIFMFTAHWREAQAWVSEDLIIRMEPEIGIVQPYDIRREYEVMKRVHEGGVPIPRVYCCEEESKVLERPFMVMEKIEGESLPTVWLKQPDHRVQLMKDYVSILLKIHGLNWHALSLSFLGVPESEHQYAEKEIARWDWMLKRNQYNPYPIMSGLVNWLKRNIPRAERTTVCHGDYTMSNAYVRDGRVVSIFDWEIAGLGDPTSDVAWACFFGEYIKTPDWDETAFLHIYEDMTGTKVNERSLLFWKALAYLKIAAITTASLRAGNESQNISTRLMVLATIFLPRIQDGAARMLGF